MLSLPGNAHSFGENCGTFVGKRGTFAGKRGTFFALLRGGMEHEVEHLADDPVHAAEVRLHVGIRDVEPRAVREAKRDVLHRHVAIVSRDGGERVPRGVEGNRLDAQVAAHGPHPVGQGRHQRVLVRRFVQIENPYPLRIPITIKQGLDFRHYRDGDKGFVGLLLPRFRAAILDAVPLERLARIDIGHVHPGKAEGKQEHVSRQGLRLGPLHGRAVPGNHPYHFRRDGLFRVLYLPGRVIYLKRVPHDDDIARVIIVISPKHLVVQCPESIYIGYDRRGLQPPSRRRFLRVKPSLEARQKRKRDFGDRQSVLLDERREIHQQGLPCFPGPVVGHSINHLFGESNKIQILSLVHPPVEKSHHRLRIFAMLDGIIKFVQELPHALDTVIEGIPHVPIRDRPRTFAPLEPDEWSKDGRRHIRRRTFVINADLRVVRPVRFLVVLEYHPCNCCHNTYFFCNNIVKNKVRILALHSWSCKGRKSKKE